MIIRKPFAFLVHRFKLLHFIILIPITYLIYMFWNLMGFFNDFVVDGYVTSITNAASIYYNFLMIVSSVIIIVFLILNTSLFKRKNRFYFPYLLLSIFFLILLVYTLFLKGLLVNAVNASLASSTSLIIRGLTSILFYGLIISFIFIILLAFGLDIRTGEFSNISDEINLDEEDSEEVEINLTNENYKFKRWINKYAREIKYYIIDNKNVFKVLGAILGIILSFFMIRFIISLNRVVRVDQVFSYSNLSISFNSSILTTLDYSGNVISEGKVYLANKVSVTNNTNGRLTLSANDFCLEINNDCIYPTLDKSGKFLDMAKPYYGEKIGSSKSFEYVLVYELDENQAKSKYKIKILDSLTYKEDEVIAKYKEINLNPSFSNSVKDVKTYSLNEEVNLKSSNLLETKLNVKFMEFSNKFRYNYEYCYQEKCTTSLNGIPATSGKTLMILDADFTLDENASYTKYKLGTNAFFSDFASIKYQINGVENTVSVVDKTPKEVSDKIVLETNSAVVNADKIDLILTIRDKRYTINLRDKEA